MAVLTEDEVLGALKQCYDPEIPVNVVDLGLIYGVRIEPVGDQQDVAIDMTLTAQGCPEHVNISAQVKNRLEQLPGVRNANVNIVWTPPWTPDRLSAEARKQLGIEELRLRVRRKTIHQIKTAIAAFGGDAASDLGR